MLLVHPPGLEPVGPYYSGRPPIRCQTGNPCLDLAMTYGTDSAIFPNRLDMHPPRRLYRSQARGLQMGLRRNPFKSERADRGPCRGRINKLTSGLRHLHGRQKQLRSPLRPKPPLRPLGVIRLPVCRAIPRAG